MTMKKAFKDFLYSIYQNNPCKILPNAIWKTVERIESAHGSQVFFDDVTNHIDGLDQNGFHLYWNEERKIEKRFSQLTKQSDVMIIHDDYFQQITIEKFTCVKPFFRICHESHCVQPYKTDERYQIYKVKIEKESEIVSRFIADCYETLRPSEATVLSWTKHKVYDENLWIWMIDKQLNRPAALGIGEYDPIVQEGSLEWIQVLPEYRGKGLGKAIVLELLRRLNGKALFTTVSGEMNNRTKPEKLYRNCGFSGDDVWWLLQK